MLRDVLRGTPALVQEVFGEFRHMISPGPTAGIYDLDTLSADQMQYALLVLVSTRRRVRKALCAACPSLAAVIRHILHPRVCSGDMTEKEFLMACRGYAISFREDDCVCLLRQTRRASVTGSSGI